MKCTGLLHHTFMQAMLLINAEVSTCIGNNVNVGKGSCVAGISLPEFFESIGYSHYAANGEDETVLPTWVRVERFWLGAEPPPRR